jgi:hypothetical protein
VDFRDATTRKLLVILTISMHRKSPRDKAPKCLILGFAASQKSTQPSQKSTQFPVDDLHTTAPSNANPSR